MNKYIWSLGLLDGIINWFNDALGDVSHFFHCVIKGITTNLHLGLIDFSMFVDNLFMYVSSYFIRLFTALASIRLFQDDNTVYNDLAKKVYVFMVFLMFFILAYNLIYHVIDPDNKNSKVGTPGQTAKKIVIALIGILFAPTAFNFLGNVQTAIVKYNTIGKLIFPDQASNSGAEDAADSAIADIYKAFVYPTEDPNSNPKLIKKELVVGFIESCGICNDMDHYYHDGEPDHYGGVAACKSPNIFSDFTYESVFVEARTEHNFFLLHGYLSPNVLVQNKIATMESQVHGGWKADVYRNNGLTYIPGVPLIVFIYLCYTVFLFLFDLALRMFNLFFLEIMSPIAFGMYLLPPSKDKMFNTWLSAYFKTYALVFVKMLFLFMMLWLMQKTVEANGIIATIMSSLSSALAGMSFFTKIFLTVIILCGLFRFINNLPKFLKDSFGFDINSMGKSSAKAIFGDIKEGFAKTKKAVTAPYHATKKAAGHAAGAYGGARYGLKKIKDNMKNAKTTTGKMKGFMSGLNALRHSTAAGMKAENARAGVLAGQAAYQERQQAWRNEKNAWKNMFANVEESLKHIKISTDGFRDQIKIVLENNSANIAQADGVVQKNMDNAKLAKVVTDKAGGKVARLSDDQISACTARANDMDKEIEAADSDFAAATALQTAAQNGFVVADQKAEADFRTELIQARNAYKARVGRELTAAEEENVATGVVNKFKNANRIVHSTNSAQTQSAISAYSGVAQEAAKRKESATRARGQYEAASKGEMIFTDHAVKSQFDQKVQAAYDKAKAANPNLNEAKFKADYGSTLAQQYMEAGLMISSSTTLGARESYAQELAYTRYEDLSAEQKALMTEEEYHAHQASAQQQAAILKGAAGEIALQFGTDGGDLDTLGLSSKDRQVLDNAIQAQLATSEVVQSLIKSGDLQEINDSLSRAGVVSDALGEFPTPEDANDPKKHAFDGQRGKIVTEFAKQMKTVDSYNTKVSQEEKLYQAKTGGTGGSNGSGGSK